MSNDKAQVPHHFNFVRSFQGIEEFLLDNGLKVLLFEDPSQANVTINITYLVGSRHEGRGEAGMAHLLEHMLFRGTSLQPDIKGVLQDRGAQFNATTWFDRTNYYETLTPTVENLDFALKLEADRMIGSLILQEDLESEMTVVRNEFEMGENNPVHVLHDQMMSAAYRWHNYGKSTIGNRSDIERVPAKTLRKFYEYYYQPDNAVLIVAGQFNKQTALELIGKYFGPIPKPSRVLDETYTEEPAQDGPRQVDLFRVGDMASVAVGYHIPAASHPDHAAVKIFFDAIADEPAGLLYQKLVETNKCSEVFSMSYALYEPGMGLCFVRPTDVSNAHSVREELIWLMEHEASVLTATQVERIKTRSLKKIKLALSNSKELALKLSESIACGDFRLFFWYRDQLQKVSLDDVVRVAKKYIIESNRTCGVFIPKIEPERVLIEKAPALISFIESVKEDPSLAAGERFIASAQRIEELITRRELSPEKRIAFLAKKTRGQAVRAHFRFRFGNSDVLLPYLKDYWLIPSLLWRGTSKYSYQEIRDQVDGLMSSLDIDGHAGILSASIKSERATLGSMMSLMAHLFDEPAFKHEEFLIVKQREIDNYEEIRSDPQRLGFHELDRLKHPFPKDHMLYVHTFDEIVDSLKSLSVAGCRKAYESLFSAEHFFSAVVGDCDTEELLENFTSRFAKKSSAIPYERVPRPYIANLADSVELNTKDKEMAIIAYGFNFPMRDDHKDYPALKLANYIFGENMNSRLMHRIREKEGISYGAGSHIDISRFDESAGFSLYAMAAPESLQRAKAAIEEEWAIFLSHGISEQELNNAKESIWLSFENLLSSDGFLVSALSHDIEIGRDFLWRERLYLRIKELTVGEIKAAVTTWWGNARFSKVVAGDLAKMK